ncbi:Hypothetical predicted protein [Paramuricea clavata]|uniref:Uncharacterized protein n=1 Tax=Paramuricea clavata TaxID=317549 RepID=A0A7D9ECZ4_PARCT|nr:Hypothetical predicted protein [Paramuricea clavata]
MERQQATVERFTTGMELPKREFLYFDGNPVNYTRFMRNFELNVENRVQETSVKLSFLIQYTSGTGREAIENCVILPADEEFVEKNASTANTIFGKLVGAKPDDDNKNKFRPQISNKGTLGVTRYTETQTSETRPAGNVEMTGYKDNNSHPARKQVRCIYCNQTNHDLERCYKFREKTHKETMDFVRKEKLCDNCLPTNI